VEIKTNDGAAPPQVRWSVTSGVMTAEVWIRRSRVRFDTGAGSEGLLNVASSAAGTPVVSDIRFSDGALLPHEGTAWRTVTTHNAKAVGAALQAGGADFAEWVSVEGDAATYEPGDLLVVSNAIPEV
jgi:hypothetical protein